MLKCPQHPKHYIYLAKQKGNSKKPVKKPRYARNKSTEDETSEEEEEDNKGEDLDDQDLEDQDLEDQDLENDDKPIFSDQDSDLGATLQ
jgi:hypothetical protein